MSRGALKANAIAVARRWVGNSSGSQTGIHEYCPMQKNPFTAAASSSNDGSSVHQNSTHVMAKAIAKNASVIGLRPNPSASDWVNAH